MKPDPFDFTQHNPSRPQYGRRIIRGLRIMQSLLLDHIQKPRTSEWWRQLSPQFRKDVEHAADYLVRFIEWYEETNKEDTSHPEGTEKP